MGILPDGRGKLSRVLFWFIRRPTLKDYVKTDILFNKSFFFTLKRLTLILIV